MPKKIIGFSKLSREEKIDWLSEKIFDDSNQVRSILDNYLNSNKDIQAIHDSFSENSISNFSLWYKKKRRLRLWAQITCFLTYT